MDDMNETEELHDCIRKLSSAQSRLRFLVVQLLETQEGECAQEVLDLTTEVRQHIQNNFQKLRIGLDSIKEKDENTTSFVSKTRNM